MAPIIITFTAPANNALFCDTLSGTTAAVAAIAACRVLHVFEWRPATSAWQNCCRAQRVNSRENWLYWYNTALFLHSCDPRT